MGQQSLSSVSVASLDSASLWQDSPPTSPRTNDSSSIYNKALDLSSIFDGYGKIGNTVTYHALRRFRSTRKPIQKYLFLRDLQLFNPRVYFHLLMTRTEELLPYIYTPTVGEACETYHELPVLTQGLYISLRDRGNIFRKLKAWKQQDVRVAVVTDGERILGLGDLGANGMGISEGKIQLYTAAAGVNPAHCLPICLDVGTNNAALLADPRYKGLRQPRVVGEEYDEFIEEFMAALRDWQPHLLLQFEDFGNNNAFRLLERYQPHACTFNDDIQGTACITLAGILSALRAVGQPLSQQRVLFFGAGEAGTGIGELIAQALVKQGSEAGQQMSITEARQHCWFMDSKGLICAERPDAQAGSLAHHKVPFAHAGVGHLPDLLSAVRTLKPTILIGVSTIHHAFNQQVVEAMCEVNPQPIIFPLSNPTCKSECSFEQAAQWSRGSVLFDSGSPFQPLCINGEECHPAQANNAYVFPAVGHAAVLTRAKTIPNDVFLVAAETLAGMTSLQELRRGFLFPSFSRIREVSVKLMAAVAAHMVASGLASPRASTGTGRRAVRRPCGMCPAGSWSPATTEAGCAMKATAARRKLAPAAALLA
uniref:Malic enzyme n=1 Tax=Tetradesmus obliquus TaxID=3088 RepID=A0A383VNK3_TETOB|eukprot:jgi/Sobl393_1/10178/SZX66314.1